MKIIYFLETILALFFTETVGRFGTKIHMKAEVRMGMKIFTNELGHMTNMATMHIYGKNRKKIWSHRLLDGKK